MCWSVLTLVAFGLLLVIAMLRGLHAWATGKGREALMADGLHCDDCGARAGGRPLWLWEGGALIARAFKLALTHLLCAACRSKRLKRIAEEGLE